MRVLYLTGIPAPYRVDLFNEMGKQVDLTVAFLAEYQEERNKAWQSSSAQTFQAVFLNKGPLNGKQLDFSMVRYLSKHAKEFDIIVIHGYSFAASILAIKWLSSHRVKFGIEADGAIIPDKEKWIRSAIKRFCISKADFWMSSGKATTDFFVHYGADREKCYVYPFSSISYKDIADAKRFNAREKKEIRGQLNITEQRIIISVGRFSYEGGYGKGYDLLMKIAEKTDDKVGFYFIGDEPTEEFLRWKQDCKLDHVHFVGFREKEELYKYYACADLFVLLTRGDVWGLAINEAMMFGLPIITTTKCLAGLELVQNGKNGYIVDVNDFDSIYKTVSSLIYDDERLSDYGKNSIICIVKYSLESSANMHLKTLAEVWRT